MLPTVFIGKDAHARGSAAVRIQGGLELGTVISWPLESLPSSVTPHSPRAVRNSQLCRDTSLVTNCVLLSVRTHRKPVRYPTSHRGLRRECLSRENFSSGNNRQNHTWFGWLAMQSNVWSRARMGRGRQDFESFQILFKGNVLYGKKHYLLHHPNFSSFYLFIF